MNGHALAQEQEGLCVIGISISFLDLDIIFIIGMLELMLDASHYTFGLQIKLSQERDQLAMTAKKLSRDLSKVRIKDMLVVQVKYFVIVKWHHSCLFLYVNYTWLIL